MIRIQKKKWKTAQFEDDEIDKKSQVSQIRTIEPDNLNRVTTDGR